METKKMPLGHQRDLTSIRTMTEEAFIERHASGTLRKNRRLGMKYRSQYLHERTCFEFGYGFECVPTTRVTFNDAMTEADCGPVTEAGWFADRHIALCPFAEDLYEIKYVIVEPEHGTRVEGIGLVLKETSAPWVPDGYIVLAIIAEFDRATDQYLQARNPS